MESASPVVDSNYERPSAASVHVVPECEAVAGGGRRQDVTDQDGVQVAPTRGVHRQVVT